MGEDTKNKKYPWQQPGAQNIAFTTNVQNWIDQIFPLFIQAIRDEEDRDALNVTLDYFIDELKVLGPESISSLMDDLIAAINLYLKEETQCQQSSDPQNNETKNITTKHRWISDTIADLIATLAELWGPSNKFGAIFDKLFANLLSFGRESRHPQDQSMVVGCIADCCSRLKGEAGSNVMSPFSDTIYKLSLRIAQSEDVNMRQNALYCMGAMFSCCDTASNNKHSQAILQCIQKYVNLQGDKREIKLVRENAVSALGKMLISEPNSLPTKELLPIFLNSLPLTCDFTENQYVFDVLIQFVDEKSKFIQPHIEKTIDLLGLALSNEKKEIQKETISKIIKLFKKITIDEKIQQIIKNSTKLSKKAKENIFNALK